MKQKKVCCFGELLFRLSPKDNWQDSNNIPFYIGGTELNVAMALANWHLPVKYITAVPDNHLTKELIGYVSAKKIDTADINFSGNRIGIYYLPFGTELKHVGVIYDRAHSSFSELRPGMIDWNKVLEDCDWFHFSAISVALNENIAAICEEALEVCAARNLIVSVDLNYRSKLWQGDRQPIDVMPALVKHCDVVMGNIWSAESLLGIPSSIKSSEGKSKEQLITAAAKSIKELQLAFPKAKTLAYTYRLEDNYIAAIQQENDFAVSEQIEITNVIDKVGSGDCFMAGLIYGLYNNNAAKDIIDFAASAAVGKLNEAGDFTNQRIEGIKGKVIMNKEQLSIQKIKEQGLLPLFYHDDPSVCIAVAKALYEGGVRTIEFTNRGIHAFKNFIILLKERDRSFPELLLGAGTIKTGNEATSYIENGADFLVSPVFDKSVCDVAHNNKILWVPGCTTPTEIHVAQQAGCSFIKLFPGNLLGANYIDAIQPLFTGLDFMVTGGVDASEENISGWFKSGVSCIGMGSKLITKHILQNKDYAGLTIKTKEVLAIIKKLR